MIVYDINERFKLIFLKKVVELVCKGEYEWAALSEQISNKVEETIVYNRHILYVYYTYRMCWFRICWLNWDWSIMQGGMREINGKIEYGYYTYWLRWFRIYRLHYNWSVMNKKWLTFGESTGNSRRLLNEQSFYKVTKRIVANRHTWPRSYTYRLRWFRIY
jgi:hypothetical protein